jgi:hypothetical protein
MGKVKLFSNGFFGGLFGVLVIEDSFAVYWLPETQCGFYKKWFSKVWFWLGHFLGMTGTAPDWARGECVFKW